MKWNNGRLIIIIYYIILLTKMGNVQPVIADMNNNEKLYYLYSKGIINDELLKLYRDGTMSLKDIESVVFESINKNDEKIKNTNKNNHK